VKELRCTLICDGPSDVALIPVLAWLLRQHCPGYFARWRWADLARLKRPPSHLPDKIVAAVRLHPCDLLFVHRDAEREPRETRVREIEEAVWEVERAYPVPPIVRVVPVRMQEAWLLFDEAAIRSAAGNPTGRSPVRLPASSQVEAEPNPKAVLNAAIREASELSERRKRKLNVAERARGVAKYIDDFAPLRELSAFAALEAELRTIVTGQGWQTA